MLLHKSVVHDSRVRREARTLAQAGHDVTVLELAEMQPGSRLDGFARRSVLPPKWVKRLLPFHLYRLAFLAGFVAGARRLRPDVIHAHDAAMLAPGAIAALLTRAQLVYDSHELATSVPYRERSWAWLVEALERAFVPRCAAVITVSDGIAERLHTRYRLKRRPTVVRNVSDLPTGGSGGLRRALQLESDPATPVVLHQGAPAPGRGCEMLTRAVAQIPGAHLAFLGDPEPGYADTLNRTIAAQGLQDRVTLLPSVSLAELLSWTEEADVGVTLLQDTCLNHRLALPNKLFEYIAAGVPVVGSDLPEIRAIVDGYGVGRCATPDDPDAVAAAIGQVLARRDDPALADRIRHAASELSWSREQDRLLEAYALLNGDAASPAGGSAAAAPAPAPRTRDRRDERAVERA
jgi:glycosyltransferase involved in cell wall biosynthesis